MKITRDASNIILITIDCLRFDHLGCYGYHRDTSPNMDSLASRGLRFEQALSNGGATPFAFPSILASTLPPLNSSECRSVFRRYESIAGLLKKAGYTTAAFHSNPYISRFYGYGRGFDIFDDSFNQRKMKQNDAWRQMWNRGMALRQLIADRGKALGKLMAKVVHIVGTILEPVLSHFFGRPIVSATEINRRALSWLNTCEGKFFLWIHYMDVHHPNLPEAQYIEQLSDKIISRKEMLRLARALERHKNSSDITQSEVNAIVDLYDASIRYVDDCLGMLLTSLGERLSNTLVIVTADHGDELGEHEKFGHNTVYDELLRIPLIMVGPGINGGTVISQQVSLIDLAPTILDFVSLPSGSDFQGRSLLSLIEGKERGDSGVISTLIYYNTERYISYRVPGWKYIRTESLDGIVITEEVYDLENDPGEMRNLRDGDNKRANRFKVEAEQKIKEFKLSKIDVAMSHEKQRIREKLGKIKRI